MVRLQPDTSKPLSTVSSEDRKKELRRVYRKLKGVRSQLSVKMRELKKEIAEAKFTEDEEDGIREKQLETASREEEGRAEDPDEEGKESRGKGPSDSMQFEVKALVDHNRRLRKRFWKLQEEARKSK